VFAGARFSMSDSAGTLEYSRPASRFYWGWINVVVAAFAMTATLPGRTHGLGLITEPLTHDPTLEVNEQSRPCCRPNFARPRGPQTHSSW
jgi:hypothetical protein